MIAFKCGRHWTAAYQTPLLASIMQHVHQSAPAHHVSGDALTADGLRTWLYPGHVTEGPPCPLPELGQDVGIAFAVLCAAAVHRDKEFTDWADGWLAGVDRAPNTALKLIKPVRVCDRAYVAHWAVMSAAFPHDRTLPAQTAALLAANVCPQGTFDFASRAELATSLAGL